MSRQYLKIIFIVKSQKPDTVSDTMAAGGRRGLVILSMSSSMEYSYRQFKPFETLQFTEEPKDIYSCLAEADL